MIVKCKALRPTPAEAATLGISTRPSEAYSVTLHKTYVVLGLSFLHHDTSHLGRGTALAITDNENYMVHAPLVLFEMVDRRVSAKWICNENALGNLCLYPPSFFEEYYFDDLIEGMPNVVADFRKVYAELSEESIRESHDD